MARVEDLVTCPKCNAKYDGDIQFTAGYYGTGTADKYTPMFVIPLGKCPVCRHDNGSEPKRIQ